MTVGGLTDAVLLREAGEFLAAGYAEEPDASPLRRTARALRRHFESASLPAWTGESLYPCGPVALPLRDTAVQFSYTASMMIDSGLLAAKTKGLSPAVSAALGRSAEQVGRLYRVGSCIPVRYSLGGGGYTHGILHYGRVLREGLTGYRARIATLQGSDGDGGRGEFFLAMRDLLAGLETLCGRVRARVVADAAALPAAGAAATALAEALAEVPWRPARTFYEALVATNWLWYLDGSDSLGRFDRDVGPYLDADLAGGRVTREKALALLRLLWRNADDTSAWNVAIGGSDDRGTPAYGTLTELCLEAAVGRRRPNLALRVRQDMPEAVWDRTVAGIAAGGGLPALYNEEAYRQALPAVFPGLEREFGLFAFGGCTESMVHGCSHVGSIDGGLNLLAVVSDALQRDLPQASSFEELMTRVLANIRQEIRTMIGFVNQDQQRKAEEQPQPLRTLLIDDCLDRGIEYNAGGARYNGSVINLGGLANAADSLAAVRELVFGGDIGAARLQAALEADFCGEEPLRQRLRACPKFGNDDDRVDGIAVEIARAAFDEIGRHRCWRGGGRFEPACILFVTYTAAGEAVPATPDGRRAGEPIADSIGAMQGRDTSGPTALLRSVCKLPLKEAVGTPILNVRFSRDLFRTPEGRERFRAFVRAFFAMGGMQIQVSVIDQEVIRDAIAHPERHGDLIVRIGGYSEYFNRLSPALQRSVLERTEHG